MADVKYDESVLQTSVNRLYAQADALVEGMAFMGLLVGGIAGYVLSRRLEGAAVGCLLGLILGYGLGKSRAFHLRVQAQTLLVSMQIERNTRARDAIPAAVDSADVAVTARDAVIECFENHPGASLSVREVEAWITRRHPPGWKDLGTTLADLTIDGNETSKYLPEQKFLERVSRGVYRVA